MGWGSVYIVEERFIPYASFDPVLVILKLNPTISTQDWIRIHHLFGRSKLNGVIYCITAAQCEILALKVMIYFTYVTTSYLVTM
jgi:hypothetical protein